MSTLEINKIVAAVLTVGVVASMSAFLAELVTHPQKLEQPVYVVAGDTSGEEAEVAAVEEIDDVAGMLQEADAAAGEKVAKKCTSCHTFDQGGAHRIGPNLWNVVNRPIGSTEGFSFSAAMAGMSGQQWTYHDLNEFLKRPKDYAPGTKMTFAGLKKIQDRANILAYMRSLSDSPAPLPEAQ